MELFLQVVFVLCDGEHAGIERTGGRDLERIEEGGVHQVTQPGLLVRDAPRPMGCVKAPRIEFLVACRRTIIRDVILVAVVVNNGWVTLLGLAWGKLVFCGRVGLIRYS